ncbi:MAG: chemotaxis protein CheW [Thermodesulfobacteriota bacterium]
MDEEILGIFFSEAVELIEAMESGLLALEKDPEDQTRIHSVFRAAHTMKGNAATVGLDHLIRFAHAQENVLDLLRQGKLRLTPEITSLLLSSVDLLRGTVQRLIGGEEPEVRELEALEGCLKAVEAGTACPAPPRPARPAARRETTPRKKEAILEAVEAEEGERAEVFLEVPGPAEFGSFGLAVVRKSLEEALFADHRVFALRVLAAEDLLPEGRTLADLEELIGSYGQILASDFGEEAEAERPVYHALLATVLEEKDLVGLALNLPEERVFVLEPEDLGRVLAGRAAPGPKPVPAAAPVVSAPMPPQEKPRPRAERPGPAAGRKTAGAGAETIRVNVDLIDTLMNLAGELVLGRNQLRRILEGTADRIPGLGGVLQNVNVVTSDLQEHIVKMRMQPVGNVMNKFPRLVRDLSLQLGKEVELAIQGGEVELDKSILEALYDPLTHLVRNAVDHAIEPPEERAALGKPRAGRVSLRALHEEGQVHLIVSDDGRGISPERVLEKALSLGLVDPSRARLMSESEKLGLIFLPGVSLAAAVTDISGRGVGMDVVKTNLENIGGHLEIESEVGRGTTLRLRLPLTLAIIPSLIVRAAGQSFALPQTDVAELVCVEAKDAGRRIEKVGEADVLRLRDRLLPLVRLADLLGFGRSFVHPETQEMMEDRRRRLADRRNENQDQAGTDQPESGRDRRRRSDRRHLRASDIFVVVLRVGSNRFGLIVDELLNTEEIVVKPLQAHLRDCKAFSGTTIMGDGTVAMILSANGLADTAGLIFGEVGAEERRRQEEEARRRAAESDHRLSFVVFNNAPDEFFALPLASVARLERLDPAAITRVGGREYAAFRGAGLPLIRLEHHLPVRSAPADAPELYVIIPRTEGPPAGIIASQIVDTIETDAAPAPERVRRGGLAGTAILEGHLTMFLDAEELMDLSARGH